MPSEKDGPREGWGFPRLSKKAHYFHDGRSLCMKWGFFGELEPQKLPMPAERGIDDCADCHRKTLKRLAGRLQSPPSGGG